MADFHLTCNPLDPSSSSSSEDLLVIDLTKDQPSTATIHNNQQEKQQQTSPPTAAAGDEKPSPPEPAVGFGELFRFADPLDVLLMSIGSVGTVIHGCSLPVFLRFFADLVDSFGSNADHPILCVVCVLLSCGRSGHLGVFLG